MHSIADDQLTYRNQDTQKREALFVLMQCSDKNTLFSSVKYVLSINTLLCETRRSYRLQSVQYRVSIEDFAFGLSLTVV